MPIAPLPETATALTASPVFPSLAPATGEPTFIPPPQPTVGTGMNENKDRLPHEAETHQPIEQALETLNARLSAWSTNLRFSIDQDTKQVVVELMDTSTGDVIRQIPTEEALHIARTMGNLQGLALQTRA